MSYVLDINGWKKTAEIMKKEKKTTKTSKSKNLFTDTGINVNTHLLWGLWVLSPQYYWK